VPTPDDKPARPRRGDDASGRYESRGTAVWQWAADTARSAMLSASQMLRKLDSGGLSLEDTTRERARPASAPKGQSKRVKLELADTVQTGGFNPYSSNAGAKRHTEPAPTGPSAPSGSAARATRSVPSPKPRRASWWQRLLGRD
jgi:hypothetical protein